MTIDDERVENPYRPDELRQLTNMLGVSEPDEELTEEFVRAALIYMFWAEMELRSGTGKDRKSYLPTRRNRRTALKKVVKAAETLKSVLDDPALRFVDSEGKFPPFDPSILDELVTAAQKAAEAIPKGGLDPERARLEFVGELAKIFERETGKRAARRFNPDTELDSGPFLEFVKAALRPIDPDGLKGLEHVVRQFSESRPSR